MQSVVVAYRVFLAVWSVVAAFVVAFVSTLGMTAHLPTASMCARAVTLPRGCCQGTRDSSGKQIGPARPSPPASHLHKPWLRE